MKYPSFLVILCIIWRETNQLLSIVKNTSIYFEFEEMDVFYNLNRPSMFMAPVRYGADSCSKFPPPIRGLGGHNYSFLLLFPNAYCSASYQMQQAVRQGYYAFLFVNNAEVPKVAPSIYHRLEAPFFLLLSISLGHSYYIKQCSDDPLCVLLYKESMDNTMVKALPLIVVSCGVVVLFIFMGTYHIGRFLVKKIRNYRLRNRIFSIPTRRCTEEDCVEVCTICLEYYRVGDLLTVLHCRHEFHQACIRMWNGEECPLCRAALYKTDDMQYSSVSMVNASSQNNLVEFVPDDDANLNEEDDARLLTTPSTGRSHHERASVV